MSEIVHIELKVNGNIPVIWDGRASRCKKCNASIGWGITKNNKKMPFNLVEHIYESHWSTCPNADDFRRVEDRND